jgi:hypothetical protein
MSGWSSPGASPWSLQQRRWLQALGHVVYRAGGDLAETLAEAPGESQEAAAPVARLVAGTERTPPAHASREQTPRRIPVAPAPLDTDPVSRTAAPAQPASTRRPARLPDRLQLAMLRASGLDPADPAAQAAMAQWPVAQLRGDGAAKRAFWPQLRALRRRT